jgi:hypothetical protein
MHLVQLLLPLYDNTGRRVPHERFALVRDELTERFGGVTAYLRSPAEGTWKESDVMVDRLDRAWWARYRIQLEGRFGQRELMVRATPADRL